MSPRKQSLLGEVGRAGLQPALGPSTGTAPHWSALIRRRGSTAVIRGLRLRTPGRGLRPRTPEAGESVDA